MFPKISIVTPNYNKGEFLEYTIKSVLSQSYPNFEYIVIDGGSTDGCVDVIKEYAGKIDYWVSEPDKGCYNAMNKAIAVAEGDYCIFMNSGDYFYTSDVIECFVKENPVEDVLCGDMF